MVYISRVIRFSRVANHVTNFSARHKSQLPNKYMYMKGPVSATIKENSLSQSTKRKRKPLLTEPTLLHVNEVIDPLQLTHRQLTIEYEKRHETPTAINIKYKLHQYHRLRTVSSKLLGRLRILYCVQTFAQYFTKLSKLSVDVVILFGKFYQPFRRQF